MTRQTLETRPSLSNPAVQPPVVPRRRTKFRAITITLMVVGVLVLAVLLGYVAAPARYNVLVIGSDQRGTERARSDVLMVFSIPKSPSQPISLITLPRDTRVEVPGEGTEKITHAYALGERPDDTILGNVSLTEQTVEDFLGIPIHATAEFTFESFKDMVDFAGGVDTADGHVDGEKALKIVRNRYREGGDFARTQDQRDIFLDLAQRVARPSEIRRFYSFFTQHEQTRLRYEGTTAVWFGLSAGLRRGGKIDLTNVYTDFIPGTGQKIFTPEMNANLYYWVPNEEATTQLVEKYLK